MSRDGDGIDSLTALATNLWLLAGRRDSPQPWDMALDRTPWGKRGANWHSVAMSIDVLLIECKACNRRAALGKDDGLPIYHGNMSPVSETKFKCRKCGHNQMRSYIPLSQDEVDMFLAGDPPNARRRVF